MSTEQQQELTPIDCFKIAKDGKEQEVREALNYAIEKQNAYDTLLNGIENLDDTKSYKATFERQTRLSLRTWQRVATALRGRITVINKEIKHAKAKPAIITLTTESLEAALKLHTLFNQVKNNKTNQQTQTDLNEGSEFKRIITDDPVADASIEAIRKRYEAGMSFKEIADKAKVATGETLRDKLIQTYDHREPDEIQDINAALKPNEDGSIDL
jgi:hypothetical protein